MWIVAAVIGKLYENGSFRHVFVTPRGSDKGFWVSSPGEFHNSDNKLPIRFMDSEYARNARDKFFEKENMMRLSGVRFQSYGNRKYSFFLRWEGYKITPEEKAGNGVIYLAIALPMYACPDEIKLFSSRKEGYEKSVILDPANKCFVVYVQSYTGELNYELSIECEVSRELFEKKSSQGSYGKRDQSNVDAWEKVKELTEDRDKTAQARTYLEQGDTDTTQAKPRGEGVMRQTIEELVEINRREGADAVHLFQLLARNGHSWRRVLCENLFDVSLSEAQRLQKKDAILALIQKRDELDERLYLQSAKRLFPESYFTVRPVPAGNLNRQRDGFTLKYYKFCVFQGQVPHAEVDFMARPHIEIEIKAPGSRDLTSDIDTTISVKRVGDISLARAAWPGFCSTDGRDRTAEAEFLVQCALIHYFNAANAELFQMSAGENRDSNVYSDGFMNLLGYPKFEVFRMPNGEPIPGINWETTYSPYKLKKQQLELAASLVSLREYFIKTRKDWTGFTRKVFALWDRVNMQPTERARIRDHLNEVFRILEDLCRYKAEQIDGQSRHMRVNGNQGLNQADQAQDRIVSAMNALYEIHLLGVARAVKRVEETREEIQRKAQALLALIRQRDEQQLHVNLIHQLAGANPAIARMQQNLSQQEHELAEFNGGIQRTLEEIKGKIGDLAQCINLQQEAQIRANLFANEAYVNRSAPYHVVAWPNRENVGDRIDKKQIVMGSILQQIGFRLLHVLEFHERGASWGEVAYRVSKYGMRVAEMMLRERTEAFRRRVLRLQEIQDDLVREGLIRVREGEDRRIPVLGRLGDRVEQLVAGRDIGFTEAEYRLINADMELLLKVKGNRDLRVHEKFNEADKLVRRRIYLEDVNPAHEGLPEDAVVQLVRGNINDDRLERKVTQHDVDIWLDIAAKIIVAAYAKRLEAKLSFWGQQPIRHLQAAPLPGVSVNNNNNAPRPN